MPSHAAGKEQGRNSGLQLFSQFSAVSAGGLGSGKVSFEQILTLLALQFPPGALVTAGGAEGGWMKRNLVSLPIQETCLETLGERWVSDPSGVPEHPAPAPEEGGPPWAISVGRAGMEVMRAEEANFILCAMAFRTVPRAQPQIYLMRTFMGVNFRQL